MTAFHAAAVAAAAPAASASGGRIAKKLADAIAVRKAAGSMSDDDIDNNNDDDDDDAAAAPADAAAAPPIVPYFGATGDPTARATSLPPLPGFDAFRGANSDTVPPLLSTAVQSTAAAAALPPGRSRPSGSSGPSGSVLSFFNTNITTPSIRRTTNTTTTPSICENELLTPSSITTEGEEYGGLGEAIDLRGEEGEEVCLPAISTVWECAYINYKVVNGKDGWECQWCGLSFKPW